MTIIETFSDGSYVLYEDGTVALVSHNSFIRMCKLYHGPELLRLLDLFRKHDVIK